MKKIYFLLLAMVCLLAACKHTDNPLQTNKLPSASGFAQYGNALLVIDQQSLVQYDISEPAAPRLAGVTALKNAVDTLCIVGNGQVLVGLQAAMKIQRYNIALAPQLVAEYRGWNSHAQIVANGPAYAVLTANDARIYLYNIDSAADASQHVFDSRAAASGTFQSLAAKDNAVYALTGNHLYVFTTADNKFTLALDQDLQTAAGETMEDASVAGNELVLRSNKQCYFFDLTSPQAPALLAKIPR